MQQIQTVVEQSKESSDRVGLTQERKSSIERAQGQQRILVIEQKRTTATANHQRQLTEIQEKARKHNEHALLIRERKTSQERAEEERASNEISQKLESAEERQTRLLNERLAKAKSHNEMAQARAQARVEEEQREIDSKKTLIEEKLTRAAENRVDLSEKAKVHN